MSLIGAAEAVAEKMRHDSEGAKQLAFAQAMTKDKNWRWLTDAFGQPFGGWTPGQLAYLWRLYEFWGAGELAVTRLRIGHEPYPDRYRLENQVELNALRLIKTPDDPGLSAWVDPEQNTSSHGDGQLSWTRPITLGIFDPSRRREAWAHVDPLPAVPLEIGYTDTVTTYFHLASGSFGVARWAYESKSVVLMVPSTFVREVEDYEDASLRWQPKPMWRPSFEDVA